MPHDAVARISLIETIANLALGYALAAAMQIVVIPWFGLHASLGKYQALGRVFTKISLIRSYSPRRLFEAFKVL